MLVLSRQVDEDIVVTTPNGDRIVVTVLGVRNGSGGQKVRIGVTADKATTVHRGEVQDAIDRRERR